MRLPERVRSFRFFKNSEKTQFDWTHLELETSCFENRNLLELQVHRFIKSFSFFTTYNYVQHLQLPCYCNVNEPDQGIVLLL